MHVPASLSPFSHRQYAWLWTGNTVAAVGAWIQATAAAWVMTELAPDPLMVSLIQAANQLPVLLLALPAGALADVVDRRRYLLWTNLGMLSVSGTLAALYAFGPVSVVVLLLLTAALACFAALNSPAWASSVPLTVPRTDLPQALVLNSIGFNIARASGPAIGGVIVAASGAALAFICNAASFAIVALIIRFCLVLPRPQQPPDLPPEPVAQAVGMGVRYAMAEPSIRAALIRSATFFGSASAIWALLPLYVHNVLGQSSGTYGLMLGAIGVGAIIGGAIMPALRVRFERDTLVLLAGLLTSVALIPVVLMPSVTVTGMAMVLFGIGWIIGASNLQTTVQLACAPWVRARGLAIYQAVFNGGMGLGALSWGWLGTHAGVTGTILAAALAGIVVAILARAQRLPVDIADPTLPVGRELPRVEVHDSIAALLASARHPVLVTITYRIDASDVGDFRAALDDLRLARQRDGATAWLVARDVESPDRWVEAFRVPDWHELRRGMARVNLLDDQASQAVRALHRGGAPPSIRVLVTDSGRG